MFLSGKAQNRRYSSLVTATNLKLKTKDPGIYMERAVSFRRYALGTIYTAAAV